MVTDDTRMGQQREGNECVRVNEQGIKEMGLMACLVQLTVKTARGRRKTSRD